MDRLRFEATCDEIMGTGREYSGIGTYGEKTLHMVLKNYFEPNRELHEVKVGGYIADIYRGGSIIEIQTRDLNKIRGKLDALLVENPVTVVYPVIHTKWLCWIDPETGEVSKRRKSPKTGKLYDIFPELYKIKSQLPHERLSICLAVLTVEELRYLNGWSADRKKGSSRCDRIPLTIEDEVYLRCAKDYSIFLPASLPARFTSKDYAAGTGISRRYATVAMNVLNHIGAVERVGKEGNSFLYEKAI